MLVVDEDIGDGALRGDLLEGVLDSCSIVCIQLSICIRIFSV